MDVCCRATPPTQNVVDLILELSAIIDLAQLSIKTRTSFDLAWIKGEPLLKDVDESQPTGKSYPFLEDLYDFEDNIMRAGAQQKIQQTLAFCSISTSGL